jgi:ABC-type phosphate transport system substrate-binding protein
MKNFTAVILLVAVLLITVAGQASAETVVIVHPDNPVASLSREQVVDIYTGRKVNFPDGNPALPIDLPPDSEVRAAFYRKLVDKSVAQINAYWARLLFTGRATPPRILPNNSSVLKSVRSNRDAIAYIDSKDLDSKTKVVYRLR